ncbi:hypothetical protein FE633_41900 [Streptomyces montanus]|uniref:Integral membrane protein n=1 Tax=Streptomyces montanus TaxID=2580423 RepID=A0A5R9FD24_9ACTN|nr:hypothetical protein [Streptomyces montanus]TLS40369.1 hypothetical protein FE633_41900 [Streptomyces montanus]
MHGHGYTPPPPRRPSTTVLVLLRVIFVALPLLSIGFLAWTAPLRAAIATRLRRDWWAFAASLVIMGVSFAFLSTDDTDDFSSPGGNAGMIILLLNAAACAGYFLIVDIRHFQQPMFHGYMPPQQPPAGYGYPQTPAPGTPQTPTPQTPAPQPYAATFTPQHNAMPQTPVPPPPQGQPQRPAPARIDQVRAELDELSDYLRKHEDGR